MKMDISYSDDALRDIKECPFLMDLFLSGILFDVLNSAIESLSNWIYIGGHRSNLWAVSIKFSGTLLEKTAFILHYPMDHTETVRVIYILWGEAGVLSEEVRMSGQIV